MFSRWIDALQHSAAPKADTGPLDLQKVSAFLLLEVARADYQVDEVERGAIVQAIGRSSEMSADELKALVLEAEQQADSVVSFHEHIRLVNDSFSQQQKISLIEQLWRVAFADNELDRYEEAFIRKISDLIYVKHRDFIQAKLRVMET
ncbi:MAG: TerB family tellurite resistance protein [Gammaproteobacteria bacterium]|nr:TerB family tellurite resistance protein [Gammaproteobacteria bacterium]